MIWDGWRRRRSWGFPPVSNASRISWRRKPSPRALRSTWSSIASLQWSESRRLVFDISARRSVGGGPLRGYARLVGAPNCAPSLRSVAGLLLALALESRYEDPLRLPSTLSLERRAEPIGSCEAIEDPADASPRTNNSSLVESAR